MCKFKMSLQPGVNVAFNFKRWIPSLEWRKSCIQQVESNPAIRTRTCVTLTVEHVGFSFSWKFFCLLGPGKALPRTVRLSRQFRERTAVSALSWPGLQTQSHVLEWLVGWVGHMCHAFLLVLMTTSWGTAKYAGCYSTRSNSWMLPRPSDGEHWRTSSPPRSGCWVSVVLRVPWGFKQYW